MAQTHERFEDYQCTYIDLPSETVQCNRTHDHLKVILRKHRDVIFHITAKTGAMYTVESEISEFYCPVKNTLYSKSLKSPKLESVVFSTQLRIGQALKRPRPACN